MSKVAGPPAFRGGRNIALKLPPAVFEATVAFYRDTLKLAQVEDLKPDIVVEFGPNRLWLDCVEGLAEAEIWLEVVTPDTAAAKEFLRSKGVERCDEVEKFPEGFDGFWVRSPGLVVHLVRGESV